MVGAQIPKASHEPKQQCVVFGWVFWFLARVRSMVAAPCVLGVRSFGQGARSRGSVCLRLPLILVLRC